jgi:type VI protein secretion system component Hcp
MSRRLMWGVAVILLLLALPSFAALNAYLKMDTIPGESTDPSHAGWIEAQGLNFGTSHAQAVIAPGAARCSIHSLNFTKRVDKASPMLARTAMNGAPIPNVTLEVNGERHMLQNVTIASVQQTQLDGRPAESISLNFARCATHDSAVAMTSRDIKHKIDFMPNGILVGLTPRPESLSILSLNFIGTNQATLTRKSGGDPQGVLMRACANGKHFPTVTITARTGQKWTFSDVSFAPSVTADSFSLNFAKVDGPMTGFQDLAYKE